MNYVLVVALFAISILLCFYLVVNKKRLKSKPEVENEGNNYLSELEEKFLMLTPKIEELSYDLAIDKKNLYEIVDLNIIAKIDACMPQVINTVKNNVNQRAIQNINDVVNNQNLYKVIIPNGAKLYNDKTMEGAFRGGYHVNNQLAGQAHLMKVTPSEVTSINLVSQLANTVSSAMNIASIVVGQYYMAEIDSKMEKMQVGIDKISEFQQTEFKSKIISLIGSVGKITKFNVEIIENDEIRQRTLSDLSRYENKATELLQQVNFSIDNLLSSNSLDYSKYQETIQEIEKLRTFQEYLLSILEEISCLTYLLNRGIISFEYCYSTYTDYFKQSESIRRKLFQWHESQIEKLDIDISKSRISKKGFEGAIFALPGIVNSDLKYNQLSDDIVRKLNNQREKLRLGGNDKELLEKDTNIIVRNGKYYYLTQ
ncbi:hypothetical protein [Streptococcus pluranimalium]|uniref:hypothetical protein n=1 Tax=Streptococcus pluranimalium TaxID=82348 RepID=UPI0039FC97DA